MYRRGKNVRTDVQKPRVANSGLGWTKGSPILQDTENVMSRLLIQVEWRGQELYRARSHVVSHYLERIFVRSLSISYFHQILVKSSIYNCNGMIPSSSEFYHWASSMLKLTPEI